MILGVYTNYEKDPECIYTGMLLRNLTEMGAGVVVPEKTLNTLRSNSAAIKAGDILKGVDAVICLGGDGTFLKIARMAYRDQIPILGINLGSLGFLTDVDKTEIPDTVKCIMSDKYKTEERMMLDTEIIREGKTIARDTALNDIVISRGAISRIVHIKAFVNDILADVFPGDGLIVSTPTGSTAYSLSAGGPIVEPDTDMMIITPICPHILYTRSFVTGAGKVIKAVVEENYEHEAMVTVDGQQGYEVRGGDAVIVKKSCYRTRIIKCRPKSFFDVLRNKIYYRGEDIYK